MTLASTDNVGSQRSLLEYFFLSSGA